ncbi:Scramblase [Oesophagostomum dentatum]|uniref:Phospholipid scramblase n=1 Tax=Oesophagostomum dentatum TaxID=61180 RepID=A0A0B1RW13_OESDE|nr:Scramblase [Oesophagostomum dentatum]
MKKYAPVPQTYPPPNSGTLLVQQYAAVPTVLMPVTAQPGFSPGQIDHVRSMPQPMQGVPTGLEELCLTNKIIINQTFGAKEVIDGYKVKNRYEVKNANKEKVYSAYEEPGPCQRHCAQARRGFIMHLMDNYDREVLLIRRSFSCWGDGFCGLFASISCCATKCTVESPPGNVIGTIEQQWAFCASVLKIKDDDDQEVLRVKGSCSCLQCKCLEKKYTILNTINEEIGSITKKGVRFELTFLGANFDVQAKALLLGAKFLIVSPA